MSKETIVKIRETETEAERIVSDAEREAARLRAEAQKLSKKQIETAENEEAGKQRASLEKQNEENDRLIEEALAEGKKEANEVDENARRRHSDAEELILGRLKAKCR